jgi:hypothetical protein
MLDPNSETSSLLRHLGSLVAGILITRGWVGAVYTEAIIGLVVAIGMLALAFWNKRAAKRIKADTVAVALQLPPGTRTDTLNSALANENLPQVELGSD